MLDHELQEGKDDFTLLTHSIAPAPRTTLGKKLVFVCLAWEEGLNFIYLFIFMAAPAAYGSSQAGDWIWAVAATYLTAVATPDP